VRLYLDTSALVKIHVDEEGAPTVRQAVARAEIIATSMLAYVEARAAFARRREEGGLSLAEHRRIVRDFEDDWDRYLVLEVTDVLIREGARLAEAHRLRAYDAVHLASAATARGVSTQPWIFACWDRKLEQAARREGLEPLRRGGAP
jgi:uncharacterized protein